MAFQAEFEKNGIDSEVVEIDDALKQELPDMAGLVIIPAIPIVSNSSHSNSLHSKSSHSKSFSSIQLPPQDITDKSKSFLKKAFLLSKMHGKQLLERGSENGADHTGVFFAAISFLGGTFGFGDENIFDPIQGGVAGLVKTAALEWQTVLCRAIDMDPHCEQIADNIRAAVSLILTRHTVCATNMERASDSNYLNHELHHALHNGVEIGIKNGFCIIPELNYQPVASNLLLPREAANGEKRAARFLKSDDVVVITGGARGVTAECALELALHCSPVIILMGRSPLPEPEPLWLREAVSEADIKKAILVNRFKDHHPTPMELQKICGQMAANREITRNLEKITSYGSKVQYYCADIRNIDSVTETLEKVRMTFGKISAIVHGAGILEDKRIIDKTEAQFSAVFDTKVNGMENLFKATLQDRLKYVIFFSSVAARTGNAGQVDYAMANEVLNKIAQYYSKHDSNEHTSQCRFISINWGPWEGGMVSPALQNAFMKRGIELIPLKVGAQSFIEEISYPSSDIEVVLGASLLPDTYRDAEKSDPKAGETEQNHKKTDLQGRTRDHSKEIDKTSPVLFSREKILAFAIGNPSEAFGERYREFDTDREIARLPAPPYFFMDRVIRADAKPWEMVSGGWIESEFDMPCDGWYFKAAHTDYLPFSILLEIALQPCGWLAAYAGSALKSKERLFFRNLGGEAQFFKPVCRVKRQPVKIQSEPSSFQPEYIAKQKNRLQLTEKTQTTRSAEAEFITITVRSRMTSVSHAGGLIIQNFDMEVLIGGEYIYRGKTDFGFFTGQSLSNQTGIRNSELNYIPSDQEIQNSNHITKSGENPIKYPFIFKDHHPLTPEDSNEDLDINMTEGLPSKAIRMVDRIDMLLPVGGKYGKGFIKGSKNITADEWFFKAHFYQDPVCPGSLGIESFLQIIQFYALKTWKYDPATHELVMAPHKHKWIYRGQIAPLCRKVEVCVHIKEISEFFHENDGEYHSTIIADGLLYVDGLCIYQMKDFSMALIKR